MKSISSKYKFVFFIVIIVCISLFNIDLSNEVLAKPAKKAPAKTNTKKSTKAVADKKTKSKKSSKPAAEKKTKSKKSTEAATGKKTKSKKTVSSKSAKSKTSKSELKLKSKKLRGRKAKVRNLKVKSLNDESNIEEIKIDTLSKGVFYKELMIGDSKFTFNAHVLEADITNPLNIISIVKANNLINELAKLQKINAEYDSLNSPEKQILGSVNGNFWKAYTNYPIGPVIVGGEIVEMNSYKKWSSAFFDNRNRMYIDKFEIHGKLTSKFGTEIPISAVNRRTDSNQIVIYNYLGGDSIPYVPKKNFDKALNDAFQDIDYRDSSDIEFDTLEFKKEIRSSQRMNMIEYSIPKLTLKYLTPVAINKKVPCVVVAYDSFTVKTSAKTCILSLGKNFDQDLIPKIGDTLYLRYETNTLSNIIFMNAVSGTPRLVRDGEAKQEAEIEGSSGKRFIYSQLPRTAIGTNESMTKLYLVAVSPTMSSKKCVGATLSDMAMIMKLIGCENALNLDGGGSTIMAIDGKNVLFPNNPDISRRLSVGVGIAVKKKNKFHDAIK